MLSKDQVIVTGDGSIFRESDLDFGDALEEAYSLGLAEKLDHPEHSIVYSWLPRKMSFSK